MSSILCKRTLSAAVALTALGYLVGCGTSGDNTGFKPSNPPLSGGGGGLTTGGTTTGGTTGGLTGGATGSASVNPDLTATAATGLTLTNMLPTNQPGGASNAPTRLGIGDFGGTLGTKVVVVQGHGNGPAQGRVTLLPRNPDNTPGTTNILLNRVAGTPAPPTLTLTDPFGLMVESGRIYFTNGFQPALQGSVVRISNVQANGDATFDVVGTVGVNPLQNLANPIDIARDGNFLYVAEYQARGGGGRIRRIDETNGTVDTLVDSVNFPSALAMDTSNGRRLLYIAENGNTSGSGAQGGVARVDLNTFVAGTALTQGGVGNTASPGVTFIQPQGGDAAYVNPFDLAVDDTGNVVVTEGLTLSVGVTPVSMTAPISQGRIRVIQRTAAGGTLPTTSRIVLQGLTGTRGASIVREDATGDAVTVFFVDGPTGLNSNLRQLTFRTNDGAIFRHLLLDSGKFNALDTLFDAGSGGPPAVATNVKYTVGFLGGAQGQVIDVR